MYGYTDYRGPLATVGTDAQGIQLQLDEEDDDDENNPLRAGLWMEGDSMAPPCGTSVSTIHKLLKFASVSESDVVYDLGCGDGRVCLEALVHFQAHHCVGVELEQDLVERFQALIDALPESFTNQDNAVRINAVHADLRQVLSYLVAQIESKQGKTNAAHVKEPFQKLPPPTVLVLYLLPESVRELEPDLLKLIAGLNDFRIVCNTWGLETIEATKVVEVMEPDSAASTVFRLYERTS